MGLYLDTSDAVVAEVLSRISPLADATTNPSVIAVGKKPLNAVLPQLHETMGDQGRLFAQVVVTTTEGMANDARELHSIIADIVVKVPMTAEGLVAIKTLKVEGIPTLETAVYDAVQGLLSALAGTEYVTPYINRIDAQGGSGIRTVTNLHQLLKVHTPQTKVLAASLKTPRQALDCLLVGCEPVALSLGATQQVISYPAVGVAMAEFEQDWPEAFGKTSI